MPQFSSIADSDSTQMRSFTLLDTAAAASLHVPRLGRFTLAGRNTIQTPAYLPTTSRGAVPHLAHDVLAEHTSVKRVYVGFEDFIERARHEYPPIYKTPIQPGESALRNFMCMPDDTLLILGPRRVPPVPCPTPSSNTSVTIMSSDGYRQLSTEQYIEAIRKLRPDIVVGLADLVLDRTAGKKRRERMVDRTHGWTMDAVGKLFKSAGTDASEGLRREESPLSSSSSSSLYFAPILPVSPEQQHLYISELHSEELHNHISGLAIYDHASLEAIPSQLSNLPRLSLGQPQTPQEILRALLAGVDLTTAPFAGAASDGGIALTFVFPAPANAPANADADADADALLPLGVDMWPAEHASAMTPLLEGCKCYACTTFHRAYIRHLLNAKEMLAWSLLQIHNFAVLDRFFEGVRASIAAGRFEEDVRVFERVYQGEMPVQTGQGPRLRGYQFKTEKGDSKRNERVYGRLDEAVRKFEKGGEDVAVGVN